MRRLLPAVACVAVLAHPPSAGAVRLGGTVAGAAGGVSSLALSFDTSSSRLDVVASPDGAGEDTRPEGPVTLSGGTLSLSAAIEPVRFLAIEGRALIHRRSLDLFSDALPWGWGYGGVVRVTPVHAARDLLHVGLYGAYDHLRIGIPGDDPSPLRLSQIRAGLGLAVGSGDRGYLVELGVHYSRSWGGVTHAVTTRDEETTEQVTTQYDFGVESRIPVGLKIGAELYSGALAPTATHSGQLAFGLEGRLVDEWGLSMHLSLVL